MPSSSRSGLLGHILNPLHIILLLGVFFSVALLLVRIQVTGSFRYGFLLRIMKLACWTVRLHLPQGSTERMELRGLRQILVVVFAHPASTYICSR